MMAIFKITGIKAVLVLWLLFEHAYIGFAQRTDLDSLDRLIRDSKTDTGRIRLIGAKAHAYTEINLDSSIDLARSALSESMKAGFKPGEINNRLTLAADFCFKGNYDSAEIQLRQAKSLGTQIHDSVKLGEVSGTYGMLYGMQGKYDTSIIFFLEALRYAELKHDSSRLTNVYRNISSSYPLFLR